MIQIRPRTLLLLSTITLAGLTGCEQAEQAANSTIEKAKQSASQVLDEAKQHVDGLLGQADEDQPQDSNENTDAES